MEQLREALRRFFFPRRHSALLVAIVAAFAVRPLIGDTPGAAVVFSFAILLLLVVALYAIQVDELIGEQAALLAERRRRNIIGWVLGLTAAFERVAMIFFHNRWIGLIGSFCWMLFFGFVTWSELRGVLKQREVTSETISMSVSVYLLFGLTWGILYIVLFQLQPNAFNLGDAALLVSGRSANPQRIFPVLIYFSLTTLATIGYGDISPLTLQARYAAVAEGIAGQFYLAILVARLVGMQMSRSAAAQGESPTRASDTKPPAQGD